MKYLDEFRNPQIVRKLLDQIAAAVTRPWTLMEICGGQTHAIIRNGLHELLPPFIELVHGPGCPVCVTPLEKIDRAIAIARFPGVIFTSFGDMLRVPGSAHDLLHAKSEGADVRMVYSPLDAVKLAQANPQRQVIFFAVGFETTIPPAAGAVIHARNLGLNNFSLLGSHVLVPPAVRALQSSPDNRVQGLLAAGHVCVVAGLLEYEDLAREFHLPIVATGFEPIDLLQGIYLTVRQLEEGRAGVENQYGRVVRREGNLAAQRAIAEAFQVTDRQWRGIGMIPQSGMELRPEFDRWNAEKIFDLPSAPALEPDDCIAGAILQGRKKPPDCPAFGARCTPTHPRGATMVSSEGACNAYFLYRDQGGRS